MSKPMIVAKLQLAQSRLEALHDILQDALYQARSAGLPLHILADLERAVNNGESTFYGLANIVSRMKELAPTHDP